MRYFLLLFLIVQLAVPVKCYPNERSASMPKLFVTLSEKLNQTSTSETSPIQCPVLSSTNPDSTEIFHESLNCPKATFLEARLQRLQMIHVFLVISSSIAIFLLIYNILTKRKVRRKNREIEQANADLNHLNLNLESIVEARTKELEQALSKSQESDRLKTAFLANMSHEVRTPLNGLLGFARLLDDDTLPSHIRKQYIEIMLLRGNSLTRIINDIISIAQIESGQLEIRHAPVNINQLLASLFTLFDTREISPKREGVTLSYSRSLNDSRCTVTTDPIRLEQVLFNLIDNALKFTYKGSVEFGYKLEEGNLLKFFIKDTGVGIPLEIRSRMFTRFNRDNNPYLSSVSGTGLGLSISKGLVELIGGKIWYESTLDEGTTFYFTIPYNAPSLEQSVKDLENYSLTDFSGKVILVVEDDLISYQLIEAILKGTNARLIHVKNGEDAIDVCQMVKDIDLVIMDMRLPFLNGYEATSRIKSINPSLPIIAQTANVLSDDKAKCLKIGCCDYIPKPIDPDEFLRTVATHLHDAVSN